MQISKTIIVEDNEKVRLSSSIHWESCDQPDRELFIETEKRFGSDLTVNSHPFLIGCLIPAMYLGESRIVLEEPICPYLKEGLETVMAIMQMWSHGKMKPLTIDAPLAVAISSDRRPQRAGMVLSGGIDSLATLRLNQLDFAIEHPGAIKDALIIHGFDIGGVVERGAKYDVFDRARKAMEAVADDAGISLIPVYTNIRHLCDDRVLWLDYFFGAVLAAVGHAFSRRLDLLYLASSFDLPNLTPCGSHPLLDHEYGSYGFRIRHCHVERSRLEKIGIVSEWDTAFQRFRVCLANVPDQLNCGRCEKCVRTMLWLEALGLLSKTRAFVENLVTPDMLKPFKITIRHRPPFYEELLPYLEAQQKDDLVATIRHKLANYN